MYCWSLAWRISSITLLACEISAIMRYFEHSLGLTFLGIGMKTDFSLFCGHCWVLQICWHIDSNTFRASSSMNWNSSTGIPSPPLAWFVVMLPKAHFREMQIKTTERWVTYHCITLRMVIIKKKTNNKFCQGCGGEGALIYC